MTPKENLAQYDVAITSNTLSAGGAEKQRVLLANELTRLGHRVTLYCLQGLGDLHSLVSPSVAVRRKPFWKGPDLAHDFIISGTTNTEIAFTAVGRARFSGPALKWLLAIHNPMGPEAPPLKRFSRFGLRFADIILALDAPHAEAVEKYWKIRVDASVPNGLDLAWSEGVREKRQGIISYEFDIGYIGRISAHHKGLDLLLQTMSAPAANSLSLAIAGSGPDITTLQDRAATLGISDRIVWLGHQDVATFLTRVGALALFSRFEGQPLVLLEAQAAGVPVVASQTASARPSERVLVVDPNESEQAADALLRALQVGPVTPVIAMPDTVAAMAANYVDLMRSAPERRSKPWRRSVRDAPEHASSTICESGSP